MGLGDFFSRQSVDDVGVMAVRLQKAIAWLSGLSVIRLILAILLWALGTTVNYELFAIIAVWVIYVFGFLGSVHRRTGYLLVYMLALTIVVTLSIVIFIFAIVGGVAVAAGLWTSNGNATPRSGIPLGLFLAIAIIMVILDVAALVLEVYSIQMAYKLRKLIRKGRRFSRLSTLAGEDEEVAGGYIPPPPPPVDFDIEVPPPPTTNEGYAPYSS